MHNCVLTKAPGTVLARYFHNWFDRVLLDVPCSGDGILRKNEGVLRYWSPEDAVRKSQQQLGLARAAFHMLRPGGTLVYSSCSLSTEENEDVLLALLRTNPDQAEVTPIDQPDLGPRLRQTRLPPTRTAFAAWRASGPTASRRKEPASPGSASWLPTEWKVVEAAAGRGDDPPALATNRGMLDGLEERWGFRAPLPGDGTLTAEPRHLQVRPRSWATLAALPFYLRSGMKIASIHKGHPYLTHQAATLWGGGMTRRLLPLEWAGRPRPVRRPGDRPPGKNGGGRGGAPHAWAVVAGTRPRARRGQLDRVSAQGAADRCPHQAARLGRRREAPGLKRRLRLALFFCRLGAGECRIFRRDREAAPGPSAPIRQIRKRILLPVHLRTGPGAGPPGWAFTVPPAIYLILLLFLPQAAGSENPAPEWHKGVTFTHLYRPHNNLMSERSRRSLEHLRWQVGADWIALNPFGYQRDVDDPNVLFGGDPPDPHLRHVIAGARELGLKVMLKPHVWLHHQSVERWRGRSP